MPYARKILNSIFLHHAVKVGLDSAIVNAKEIIPYGDIDPKEKKLAEDLIFNAHPDALSDLISYFEKPALKLQIIQKKLMLILLGLLVNVLILELYID